MNEPEKNRHSFFWPIILIGVGAIWLLINLGFISVNSLSSLFQFWPLLLVILGLDILFGHRYPWVGSLVAIAALGGLIAFLVLQPQSTTTLNTTSSRYKEETFSEPLADTTSVTYYFETASEPVEINSLEKSSPLLINADLIHQGTVDFNVSGTANKMVNLSEMTNPNDWFSWNLTDLKNKWDIALTPNIPSDLRIEGGSGSLNIDLNNIQLETLTADLGSGASSFTLPQTDSPISADINSGSGAVDFNIPDKTDVTLRVESGSGAIAIDVPNDAGVMVEVMDSGSGALSLGSFLEKKSGDEKTGTWESANYGSATHRILIKLLDRGSGAISIK